MLAALMLMLLLYVLIRDEFKFHESTNFKLRTECDGRVTRVRASAASIGTL